MMQIIRFIALVATQLLVLNKIQFNGYVNPYIYFLFILLLPIKTPPVTMILTGFALGFIIDHFTGIMGVHTAATVFISFFRNRIIRFTLGLTPEDLLTQPGLSNLGIFRFIYYAGLITLIHHFILFYLEVFTFHNSFDTLLRVIVNSAISLLFIVITMILFEKRRYE